MTRDFRLAASVTMGFLALARAVGAEPRTISKSPPVGIVVEEIVKGSATDEAGLLAGDAILSWHRGVATTAGSDIALERLSSPFELLDVSFEYGSRGPVTLRGKRDGHSMAWTVQPGAWKLRLRPALSPSLMALHREARALIEAGKPGDGAQRWRATAAEAARDDRRVAIWFLWKAGDAFAKAQMWPDADIVFGEAIARASAGGWGAAVTRLLRSWAPRDRREQQGGRREPDDRCESQRPRPREVFSRRSRWRHGALPPGACHPREARS